jgi:hypothetical protein
MTRVEAAFKRDFPSIRIISSFIQYTEPFEEGVIVKYNNNKVKVVWVKAGPLNGCDATMLNWKVVNCWRNRLIQLNWDVDDNLIIRRAKDDDNPFIRVTNELPETQMYRALDYVTLSYLNNLFAKLFQHGPGSGWTERG